ncbi:MAG: carboxypeptidase regulatory-like domain-containing protein [Chloroflexi bacterium]|nr:carboxypeptidase regulatory-like domain-containing protein [Chloroflexota bacterium]
MRNRLNRRLLALLLLCSLLSTYWPTADVYGLQPVPSTIPNDGSILYRTVLYQPTDYTKQRLQQFDLRILHEEADRLLVLVDELMLDKLARLGFGPTETNGLSELLKHTASPPTLVATLEPLFEAAKVVAKTPSKANRSLLYTQMQQLRPEQTAAIASGSSIDDDNDGLTNTQEQWWCTNPLMPDTDGDGEHDGSEVQAARSWMRHERSSPPANGKPFAGWPSQLANCRDDDLDSIPDLAERWDLGLNMNRESTDRDKFDDGQELFGSTYCPGSGGFCGYGALPRNEDWGIIFAEMPAWVKTPANHPLMAAFPVPAIDLVPNSLRVQTVTEIRTDHTIITGTERLYSTASTEGTSSSIANEVNWNAWEEQSIATTIPLAGRYLPPTFGILPRAPTTEAWDRQKIGLAITSGAISVTAAGLCLATAPLCAGITLASAIAVGTIGFATAYGDYVVNRNEAQQSAQTLRQLQTEIKQLKQQANQCVPGCSSKVGTPASSQQTVNSQRTSQISQGRSVGNHLHSGATSDARAVVEQYYQFSYPQQVPTQTTTSAKGQSRGGAQTTTHTQYKEHTVTNGQAFSSGESWSNAVAVNSAHAAELWFSYRVSNNGSEYAREIGNLAFNVYIGDSPIPATTYFVGPDLGGDGKFHNFMPGESHQYTSRRIALTLDQLRAIDLGSPIRIVAEDYTYGIDELFYADALNASMTIAIEDGTADNDELIEDFLIPTWGDETAFDVLARYFPTTTDANGQLIAVWTPERRTDSPSWCRLPRRVGAILWCQHALSAAEWWNIYSGGLGNGDLGFQDMAAAPAAGALFRFNQDSDLDGYSDSDELRLQTDPHNASSFPKPELLAATHSTRVGNVVTSTLSLLNTGLYDAYSVQAIMVAPNDSVTIQNNTVGGTGRVRAFHQVVVGSTIHQPSLSSSWSGTALPTTAGYYVGANEREYLFTVQCSAPLGCDVGSGTWALHWNDGIGNTGSLNFGAGYASPQRLGVGGQGLELALMSGTVQHNQTFKIVATPPNDAFSYRINREPYTKPLVILAYNDPQGHHRLVTTSELSHPQANLAPYSGQMLHDSAGVEIIATAPFTPALQQTTTLLAQIPAVESFINARLYLEFIDLNGQGGVVREEARSVNLQPGPNLVNITWQAADFNPAFNPNHRYGVIAFLTDHQGNILGNSARMLDTFQADPQPIFAINTAESVWNFGTATQGSQLRHNFGLPNEGRAGLRTTLLGAGGRRDLAISGEISWMDTGLEVRHGDAIGIQATGNICYDSSTNCFGPDGNGVDAASGWTAPGASQFSLIARVGNNTPFMAGTSYRAASSTSGRLYLATNNCLGCNTDTIGQFQAHVEVSGIPVTSQSRPTTTIAAGDMGILEVLLDTYYIPVGPFSRTIQLRTSDPQRPSHNLQVQGVIVAPTTPAQALPISPYRPWDEYVVVTGSRSQRELISYVDTIVSDALHVTPLRLYDQSQQTLLGIGRGLLQGIVVNLRQARLALATPQPTNLTDRYGDGRDGIMPANGNLDTSNGVGIGIASGNAGSTAITIVDQHAVSRINPGDRVLIHQTRGDPSIAGLWELNTAVGDVTGSGTFALAQPLRHSYSSIDYRAQAQIMRVPQYSDCPVSGTITPLLAWNGHVGGIIAFMCQNNATIGGLINGDASGFRGGDSGNGYQTDQWQGEGIICTSNNSTHYCQTPNITPSAQGGGAADAIGGGGGGAGCAAGGDGEHIGGSTWGRGGIGHCTTDGTRLYFGGGGGGSATSINPGAGYSQAGRGGGLVFIFARQLTITGQIRANGQQANGTMSDDGTNRRVAAGSGGGGQMYLRADTISVAANGINALGAPQLVPPGSPSGRFIGGAGGHGSIRLEYCNTVTGIENIVPAPNQAQLGCYGTLAGSVYSDNNANGVRDPGEAGLATININLNTVGTATTNANGDYNFNNVPPATYSLTVTPKAGYACSNSCTNSVTVQSNTTTTVNLALIPQASISGIVFHDLNQNGIQNPGENGLAGINVALSGTGQTSVTDAQGAYSFTNLTAAAYTVNATLPNGYAATSASSVNVNLVAGATATAHFGMLAFSIEKVAGSPHQINLYIPTAFRDRQRYHVQSGRTIQFSSAGEQVIHVSLPKARYLTTTLDLLITRSNAAFLQINLDIGNNGNWEWSYNNSPTLPTTLSTTNLAAGLTSFMASATPDAQGMVSVPIRISLNTSGQLHMLNLVATPGGATELGLAAHELSLNPSNPTEGMQAQLQARIRNPSNLATGGFITSVYAKSPIFGDWYLGSRFVANIPAGGDALVSIPFPTEGFQGTIPVRVVVDPFDRVAEINETNNVVTATLPIRTRADLQVSRIQFSDSEPLIGQPISVTIQVHNAGQTTAGRHDLRLMVGATGQTGAIISSQSIPMLTAASTTTLVLPWTPTQFGLYQLTASIDSQAEISESNEANNTLWQPIAVGINGPIHLDSGAASEATYTPSLGYGVIDIGEPDTISSCGSAPHQTVRIDPDGQVRYQFDQLQPGRFYHLDITLFECDGVGRQEVINVDGNPIVGPVSLANGQIQRLSTRIDPALYADRKIEVSIEAPGIDGAVVAYVSLHPIDYRYIDAGSLTEVGYPGTTPSSGLSFGALDGVRNSIWGTLPYQSVRIDQSDATLRYRFDGLKRDRRYQLHTSFWQRDGSERIQKVQIDGIELGSPINTGNFQVQRPVLDIPQSAYVSDESIIVSIVRTNGTTGAFINEIALEERTLMADQLPPTPDFGATPLTGVAPLTVSFSDQSSGTIASRRWDFGDGGEDSIPNPIHTYTQPGTYAVRLLVDGPGGSNTIVKPNYITVLAPPSNQPLVYLSPPALSGGLEQAITATVAISQIQQLGSFQFTLAYSPALVTVEQVTMGAFPASTGRNFTPVGPTINPNAGTITFGGFSLGANPAGASGQGSLAHIRLRPRAVGTAPLTFSNVQVSNINGQAITVATRNGSIQVANCLGDFDLDGDVDIIDIQRISYRWNTHLGDPLYAPLYDIDADGDIDIIDIQRVAVRWGTQCSAPRPTLTSTATPWPTTFSLQPTKAPIQVGVPFTIGVVISDVNDLGSFEFTLPFSPSKLEILNATIDGYPSSSGRQFYPIGPQIDLVRGTLNFAAYSIGTSPVGASGNGQLATITLRATNPGSLNFALGAAQASDRTGIPQPAILTDTQIYVIPVDPINYVYIPYVINR